MQTSFPGGKSPGKEVSPSALFSYSFQVQARFWACSKSRNPGFCACGVAARDGDDVIVIDMCSGRFMETSVQISIRSKLPLAKGIRITEAISGKRYTVGLPARKFVRQLPFCEKLLHDKYLPDQSLRDVHFCD